jgi:hypothetical protein
LARADGAEHEAGQRQRERQPPRDPHASSSSDST